mmetsp:Transcript_112886/g.195978  ORF Transcript_112886/g.195978 Transcript_112886/m.195978 type:complete len:267 (-) Transcript_112886:62-862(-)
MAKWAPSLAQCSDCKALLKLAAGVHLDHDVTPTQELPIHVQLGNGGPIGVELDPLSNLRVRHHVHSLVLVPEVVEELHCGPAESTLRIRRGALHEQADLVAVDPGLDLFKHFVRQPLHTHHGHVGLLLGPAACADSPNEGQRGQDERPKQITPAGSVGLQVGQSPARVCPRPCLGLWGLQVGGSHRHPEAVGSRGMGCGVAQRRGDCGLVHSSQVAPQRCGVGEQGRRSGRRGKLCKGQYCGQAQQHEEPKPQDIPVRDSGHGGQS